MEVRYHTADLIKKGGEKEGRCEQEKEKEEKEED